MRTVAILGGGPAACTLGILLARARWRVAMWHRPTGTSLQVGESLVPAVIPILRLLGVEEEVRRFSTHKPGATFHIREGLELSFFFRDLTGSMPRYAYNVPRDQFDETLREAARREGVRLIQKEAVVEKVEGADRVALSAATLASTGGYLAEAPDWIIDATGRARVVPRLLGLAEHTGPRRDRALFAHVDRARLTHEGHVHTTLLEQGWSWQIPLPGRVSVGMVVDAAGLARHGATSEEQFDRLMAVEPMLRGMLQGARRLTPVLAFDNYQLTSERVVGDGWALVGDTAGFVDPVFSSGLFIGMQSAVALAAALDEGRARALRRYETEVRHHLDTWQEIAGFFYNGRLFTCFHVGQMLRESLLVRMTFPHMNRHLGRVFSGAASTSRYSMGLLRFAMKHGLKNEDPAALQVR